jgi:hypothetical protein
MTARIQLVLTETKDIQQAALRSKRHRNMARAFCNSMHARDIHGKNQTRVTNFDKNQHNHN